MACPAGLLLARDNGTGAREVGPEPGRRPDYGSNPDRMITKAIVSVPINGLFHYHRYQARVQSE